MVKDALKHVSDIKRKASQAAEAGESLLSEQELARAFLDTQPWRDNGFKNGYFNEMEREEEFQEIYITKVCLILFHLLFTFYLERASWQLAPPSNQLLKRL
jgi:hypothetical protein